MLDSDEGQKEVIRLDGNQDMMIACSAQITSEAGFLLLREIGADRPGLCLIASPPGVAPDWGVMGAKSMKRRFTDSVVSRHSEENLIFPPMLC